MTTTTPAPTALPAQATTPPAKLSTSQQFNSFMRSYHSVALSVIFLVLGIWTMFDFNETQLTTFAIAIFGGAACIVTHAVTRHPNPWVNFKTVTYAFAGAIAIFWLLLKGLIHVCGG